jgi:hypothetical protein
MEQALAQGDKRTRHGNPTVVTRAGMLRDSIHTPNMISILSLNVGFVAEQAKFLFEFKGCY